jgi:hypothetical protein
VQSIKAAKQDLLMTPGEQEEYTKHLLEQVCLRTYLSAASRIGFKNKARGTAIDHEMIRQGELFKQRLRNRQNKRDVESDNQMHAAVCSRSVCIHVLTLLGHGAGCHAPDH